MKIEPIEGSETSAIRTKTPGNYPPAHEDGTDRDFSKRRLLEPRRRGITQKKT